jgi:hypothetical protein
MSTLDYMLLFVLALSIFAAWGNIKYGDPNATAPKSLM